MHDLLIWISAAGIFGTGFALGVFVMISYHAAMTRPLTVPKELLPKLAEAPPPRFVGEPLPPPTLVAPTPVESSPFIPKRRPPAKPETKRAFLEELNRRIKETKDAEPPTSSMTKLPPLGW